MATRWDFNNTRLVSIKSNRYDDQIVTEYTNSKGKILTKHEKDFRECLVNEIGEENVLNLEELSISSFYMDRSIKESIKKELNGELEKYIN